jgi:hypothetical protein
MDIFTVNPTDPWAREIFPFFWYLFQFLFSGTWSPCHTDLLLACLEVHQNILYYCGYCEGYGFSNFFLSPFIACVEEGYSSFFFFVCLFVLGFFELILYTATLLKAETKLPTQEHTQALGPYAAEGCLVWPQWERVCLILQRLDASGLGDTPGGSAFSEEKGLMGEELSEGGLRGGQHLGCK